MESGPSGTVPKLENWYEGSTEAVCTHQSTGVICSQQDEKRVG